MSIPNSTPYITRALILLRTYPTRILDLTSLCGGAYDWGLIDGRKTSECSPPPLRCYSGEFAGLDSASFLSTFVDDSRTSGDNNIPETLISYLNGLSKIRKRFSGTDLKSCTSELGYVLLEHEGRQILTLLTSSMAAPVFVDGPRKERCKIA